MNFAQFFFFDGEKLEGIMNTKNLNVKESLEVLLNIKTYEKLIKNIKNVEKTYQRETEETPTNDGITRLELQKKILFHDVKINKDGIKLIEKGIKILKLDIERLTEKLTDLVADKKADIKPLRLEKEKLDKELSQLKEYISNKIKNTDFLILMAEKLSRKYLSKLEDDKTNYQLDEQLKDFSSKLRNMIRRIQDDLFDINEPEYRLESDKIDFYKDRLDELRKEHYKKFNKRLKNQNQNQIIYYHEDDKELLNNKFENKIIMYEKFIALKDKESRLKDIKNRLDNATEDASENNYFINKYKLEKDELEEKKSNKEQNIGELKKDIELKSERIKELDFEIKKLEKLLNLSKPILNSIELSEKLIDFFQEFKLRLLHKKIEDLENAFNNYLFKLSPDKDWIREVKINNKFEIKLFNYIEQEMSINSLSAGQKQILATALIQALGSVSQVKSFICIDTPLARIDLENREHIITKYYPNASKQVIILSTNSEIDPSKDEYRFMKDFISKEYTIVSDKYKSSFEDGYFNEINRG